MAEIIQVGTTTTTTSKNKKKQSFQTGLQNSRLLRRLFNGELDDKINALKTRAQNIESMWWDMARTEFANKGYVTPHTARDAADTMCGGVVTLMNQILADIADITQYSGSETTLSWTGLLKPFDANLKSLYAPFVAEDCNTLLSKMEKLREMLQGVHDYPTYLTQIGSFADLYAWTVNEFSDYGPNFPTPLTDFYTNEGFTKDYLNPYVLVESYGASATPPETTTLRLINRVKEQSANIGEVDAKWASDTDHAFHTLVTGDLIYIARLNTENDLYSQYVGQSFYIYDNADSGVLYLAHAGTGGNAVNLPEQEEDVTLYATTFGENFELRKIRCVAAET